MGVLERPQQPCPRCGRPCALRTGQFHFRGRWFSGWVCARCNALYENRDDSMFAYAASLGALEVEGDDGTAQDR